MLLGLTVLTTIIEVGVGIAVVVLDFSVLYGAGGVIAVIVGFFLFPLTLFAVPFYSWLVESNTTPFLLTYVVLFAFETQARFAVFALTKLTAR